MDRSSKKQVQYNTSASPAATTADPGHTWSPPQHLLTCVLLTTLLGSNSAWPQQLEITTFSPFYGSGIQQRLSWTVITVVSEGLQSNAIWRLDWTDHGGHPLARLLGAMRQLSCNRCRLVTYMSSTWVGRAMRLLLPYGLPSGWRSTASTQVSLPDPATLHHPPPGSHFSRSTGYKTMSDPQRFRERMETPQVGEALRSHHRTCGGGGKQHLWKHMQSWQSSTSIYAQNIGGAALRDKDSCVFHFMFSAAYFTRHNTEFLSDQLQFPTSKHDAELSTIPQSSHGSCSSQRTSPDPSPTIIQQ